jgi:hypothetical protein
MQIIMRETAIRQAWQQANPLISGGLSGLFLVVIAYAMMVAVGDQASVLAESASPFTEITRRVGIAWAAAIIYCSGFHCARDHAREVARFLGKRGRTCESYEAEYHERQGRHRTRRWKVRKAELRGTGRATVAEQYDAGDHGTDGR